MVKTRRKLVNIKLQINMASTRAKRMTAETSTRRNKKKSKKSKEDDEVLYVPNGPIENGVGVQEKKTEIEIEIQFEDDVGSRAKDVEVGRNVPTSNNLKKRFDDKNKILNQHFDFGVLEVASKKWFYDLRTPEKCLGDTV
ncbi:Uncharacterized protein Fot_13968 [Forsythia ovata]|uniref:Uncharacterized protein n=1 Tax=Forsythia ovata TaxID=205694 RepID=A0ABD1W5H4_9LAMI